MKLKDVTHRSFTLALSAVFIFAQLPQMAYADDITTVFSDLFPEDSDANKPKDEKKDDKGSATTKDDTGLFPTKPGFGGGSTKSQIPRQTSSSSSSANSNKLSMSTANVSDAYACPLFENRPHAELIDNIDKLVAAVNINPECEKTTSAVTVEQQTKLLKDSLSALSGFMDADASGASSMMGGSAGMDAQMTQAITAINTLGNVLNNNAFINSSCGRQTMSAGKALLAFNDMVNGFAPFALFAVAANPLLAPAIPWVVGGAVTTTGISIMGKMIDQNTLDMMNPEHRKAVLQNSCAYVKVAKKVRFMQLAQSGKIEKVTEELEKNIVLYRANMNRPSAELTSLLAYRQKTNLSLTSIEMQLQNDKKDMAAITEQLKSNSEDLMVCTLSRELVNWAQDLKTFPSTAFSNLESAAFLSDRTLKLQALTLKSVNIASLKRIVETADEANTNPEALKACANIGRTWISSMSQALNLTEYSVRSNKNSLENELAQNAEYRLFKAQYAKIQMEQVTIKRVEKAMQELSKDNSIIDRSELAQKIILLKNGLFGTKKIWGLGVPPVLSWIQHTKTMQERATSGFIAGLKALRSGAYSLTEVGKGNGVKRTPYGTAYFDPKQQIADATVSEKLETLTLNKLPVGSRENEIVCQQLETAWLDWSASLDHLGAIQFFCDMIDPVLDVKMDSAIIHACRGNILLNGQIKEPSMVNMTKQILSKNGYAEQSKLVSRKLKELRCPVPAVSVMNE